MKTIKTSKRFYALLCDSGEKEDELVCGIYPSRKEARDVAHEVKDCPAKHRVVQCFITVTF